MGAMGGLVAGMTVARGAVAQDSTPIASPASGAWSYSDVLGTTVTLPETPVRIAANIVTAAVLWDLGIKVVALFDWTASAHPDGDHIAWGNIDPTAVANIGDADGNIQPEEMLLVAPDIVLTMTYDPGDPMQTLGVPPDLAERIGQIAPVLVVTDMASTEIQVERLVDLGVKLGADITEPSIVEARAAYDAKIEEFRTTAASKSDLTVLFMDFDPGEIYAAGPDGVPELLFLGSLGLKFANADSPEAAEFWETLSPEAALKYPSDIVYNDVYSTVLTLADLQAVPVFAAMPAVAAGQVGEWPRDFPMSYEGVTGFLEGILTTLRTAEKVTE
jgi:iron complex transport system substrate-binding protein